MIMARDAVVNRGAITRDALEDITREYLRLRAPRALAFACPHYDRDHVHVHVAISGTEFRSSRTLRMDNRTFTALRRKIEHYQLTRYPELEHSLVHLPKRVRGRELQEEMEQERPVIERCYEEAHSLNDFFGRVADAGIDESKYPLDRTTGRYTFEVDLDQLTELELRMRELNALQRLWTVRVALGFHRDQTLDGLIERYEEHVGNTGSTRDDDVERRFEELESLRPVTQDREQEAELERP